jgi:riboflavin kinase
MESKKTQSIEKITCDNKNVNLPDLLFFNHCEQNFGINRGVYNTIDEFFFKIGFSEINTRRKTVLNFLFYLRSSCFVKESGKIKVGNRGLSFRLNEFQNFT